VVEEIEEAIGFDAGDGSIQWGDVFAAFGEDEAHFVFLDRLAHQLDRIAGGASEAGCCRSVGGHGVDVTDQERLNQHAELVHDHAAIIGDDALSCPEARGALLNSHDQAILGEELIEAGEAVFISANQQVLVEVDVGVAEVDEFLALFDDADAGHAHVELARADIGDHDIPAGDLVARRAVDARAQLRHQVILVAHHFAGGRVLELERHVKIFYGDHQFLPIEIRQRGVDRTGSLGRC